MATIEKKNGKWRISETRNGRRYRIIIERKKRPTDNEAKTLIDEAIEKLKAEEARRTGINGSDLTVKAAAEKYISAKENSLSPSTIRAYKTYTRNLPEVFQDLYISDITAEIMQRLVKLYQAEHSVKYAKNVSGFIKSSIKMFMPGFDCKITFAPEPKKEPYIPTADEVKRILKKAKGTDFELPIMFAAMCGLRRGEILALTAEDLEENNLLHITKSVAQNSGSGFTLKQTPKTKGSIRDIVIPAEVAEKLREKGKAYNGHPNSIERWLIEAQKALDIQHFTFHKLRHYYCSRLHEAGVSDATIMKLGGWSDPGVMQRIYRHGKSDYQTMKEAAMITSEGILN